MVVRSLIIGWMLLLIVACSQKQSDESTIPGLDLATRFDSCAIAMAGDEGSADDKQIRHYQALVSNSIQPLVNLEKLGWAYISLARRNYDEGYYQLALETAKCMNSKHVKSDASLLLQAYVALQLHQFEFAGQLAQELVEKRGYWFDYGLLGDALMEQGRLDDAQQAYQSMMNQRPGPQAYSRAAHLRWLNGDLSGAIEMATLAAQSYGFGKSETASWAKTRLANYLLLDGNYAQTIALIDQTLELNRDYAPALVLKSRILLVQGDAEQAIVLLKRAVELNPQPDYLWVLFETLEMAGMFNQAEQFKTQFIQTAEAADPRTYAIYLAGSTYDSARSLKLAKQELEKRQDFFSHDALAWALYANNHIEHALIHIQKALTGSTQDGRLFYHAALIYLASGDKGQALAWFEKAKQHQYLLQPSERNDLHNKFAMLSSQAINQERKIHLPNDNHKLKGDQHEPSI